MAHRHRRSPLRQGSVAALRGEATTCLVALSAFALGCSPRAEPAPIALDCTSQTQYQVLGPFENYDAGGTYGWYSYGDSTPGAIGLAAAAPVEGDGGPCGASPYALTLQSHGFQDYGSGFGTYALGGYMGIQRNPQLNTLCADFDGGANCAIDATGWDGLRFWARSYDPSGAPTTKGITIEINDKDTISNVIGHDCVDYDAGVQGNGVINYTQIGGGMGAIGGGVSSAQPPPDACGNPFQRVLLTTDHWQLYDLPFSSFYQTAKTNRTPSGFDPGSFTQITIAIPKEAALYLWIDDIGFYRSWPPEAGVEAGP